MQPNNDKYFKYLNSRVFCDIYVYIYSDIVSISIIGPMYSHLNKNSLHRIYLNFDDTDSANIYFFALSYLTHPPNTL